jgi:hypothetical protein
LAPRTSLLRLFTRVRRLSPERDQPPPKRFFVTIAAGSREQLIELNALELDVFAPTAKLGEDGEATIEGYLTLDEIGRVVEHGYRVDVREEAAKRFRAHQVQEFDAWIKGLEE